MADGLYLGKVFNREDRSLGEPFLLDPGDLTTHGIVIGMTGSGKTGLSVCLIEELLKARVPVIVVDPKGDMGNLALAFDRLAPDQFAPWVDKDEAKRSDKTPEQVAAETAETWTKGLGDWGLGTADVAAHAASHNTRFITPGATAGIPLNILDSLDTPGLDFEENEEELRDEIDSIVTALLGFVRIEADPIASREYILLFSLIERAWRAGESLDLATLIGQVANPPIDKVGALPIESFYPQKDRNALMFALNNLIASPPFEVWRSGEPLDIERWLRSDNGKPNLTILYTAHLDDEQRIFVTALVLNKLKSWMRKQPGTSELRALFYMDEIFGYFPPTANPPTKKPLLTLLKQARAYGVGIVLATQNPVDLDYKGLANMGFWAIGRLQTARDQERVRQGVEAALEDAGLGDSFDNLISGVQKRVFLIHDIHRKAPALVQSRWAMSYLRGPITREEIKGLAALGVQVRPDGQAASPPPTPAAPAPSAAAQQTAPPPTAEVARQPAPAAMPVLPAPFKPLYLDLHRSSRAEPHLFVKAAVRYKIGGAATDEQTHTLVFPIGRTDRESSILETTATEVREDDIDSRAPSGLEYADLPAYIDRDAARDIERMLKDRLDDYFQVELLYDPDTRQLSNVGEDEYDFALRVGESPSVRKKRETIETRIAKKRQDLAIKQEEVKGRKMEKWVSVGTSILGNIGLIKGRKKTVTGLGGVLSKNRMEGTAERRKAALEAEIAELERDLQELQEVSPRRFERRIVKPTKTDTALIRFEIVWVY